MERERKSKKELEKQLKESRRECEEGKILMKTSDLGQDELRKKINELTRKYKMQEEEAKKHQDEIN